MPTELVLEICSHLHRPDINALLRVSHRLQSIMTPVLGCLGAAAIDCITFRRSLLHWTAANGQSTLLRLVLRHGADVHRRDSIGSTGLHSAVLCHQPATLSILRENGADVENLNRDGWTPLYLAAITGSREIVALLLDHGVDINARSQAFNHKTALHNAALQGHRAVVELLISRGARLGARDLVGMKAAENTILADQIEVVHLVFGVESEKQIKLSRMNLVQQYREVEHELGILRRRIHLHWTVEASAVQFRG